MNKFDALFSKKSDEWATPQELFNELNDVFDFDLDPCATADNAKCKKYYTLNDNGLLKSWAGMNVFCNPPYSKITEWVQKAYNEWLYNNAEIVLLIPARTDTRYFHKYIKKNAFISFVKGRIHFNNSKAGAPFASLIVWFPRLTRVFDFTYFYSVFDLLKDKYTFFRACVYENYL